jgi:hypothetical protein
MKIATSLPDERLKQLAHKAYLSYHKDGLLDVLIGLGTIGFGMNLATDSSGWMWLSLLPMLVYVPLKNRITVPRFGYVRFDSEREARRKRFTSILISGLFALCVVGIGLVLFSGRPAPAGVSWIRENTMLFWGLSAAMLLVLVGLISRILRFAFYALMSLLLTAGASWFGLMEFAPILILGVVLVIVGAVLLVCFLRKYPLTPEAEVNNARL